MISTGYTGNLITYCYLLHENIQISGPVVLVRNPKQVLLINHEHFLQWHHVYQLEQPTRHLNHSTTELVL